MLKRIKVKNVATIHESEAEFGDHLNILTGETGAGKSILIDSIHLALGAKADKSIIRNGAEYAYAELEFFVESKTTREKLKALDIYTEDGYVTLQRRIMPGKSSLRINGEATSAKIMREAAELLINIHGQHDSQVLLQEKKHRELLDAYCGEALVEPKEKLAAAYDKFKKIEKELQQALEADAGKEREISFAQFEVGEITEANPVSGEDDALEAEFRKMEHIRVIGENVGRTLSCMENFDGEGAAALISAAGKSLQDAAAYDETLQEPLDGLLQTEELLRETIRNLQRYLDGLTLDEERYAFVSSRLDLLNHLKKKYGNTIEDILHYRDDRQAYLDKFENFEQYKEKLQADLKAAEVKLCACCDTVSEIRTAHAQKLSEELTKALSDLNFAHVAFETQVERGQQHLSREGSDAVRFMISLNAGEALKPLAQVASGGELSRIMLALKAVMADQEETESLIFDEIDAGISGKTAWKVSEKLAVLGRAHQVICITHLPQIAAMADQHYLIEKRQTEHETQTQVTQLDGDGEVSEIARLLGSDTVTEAVLANAKELKELAAKTKGY